MKTLTQCCTAAVAELHNTYSKDAQGRSSNRFPFFRVSLGSTLPLPLPLLWYLALIDLTAEVVALSSGSYTSHRCWLGSA